MFLYLLIKSQDGVRGGHLAPPLWRPCYPLKPWPKPQSLLQPAGSPTLPSAGGKTPGKHFRKRP